MRTSTMWRWLSATALVGMGVAAGCSGKTSTVGDAGSAVDGAAPCKEGDTKAADDGCNTCSCTKDGQWVCTLLGCVACIPGMTKPAPDGCNTCSCTGTGSWACTEKACVACTPGETKMVDCNTCGCSDTGEWSCTKKACLPAMCPAPADPGGQVCIAVIVYAKDPVTGLCCQYSDPCHSPQGWMTYSSDAECQNAAK